MKSRESEEIMNLPHMKYERKDNPLINSAKAIVRRHRSLHVSARTEDEAVRKASAYFKKVLASRDNKLVGEIKTDRITAFGKKGGL